MSTKFNSNKVNKRKKDDVRFFRMTGMFFLACIAILFILKIVYASGSESFALTFWRLCNNPIYTAVTGILLALALANFILKKFVQKKNESLSYITSSSVLSVFAYVFFASLFFGHANNPDIPLLVGTIIISVLYYVYHFYRVDFFMYSLASAVMCVLLWAFADTSGIAFTIVKTALVLLAFAFSVYVYKTARKINGCSCNKKALHSLLSWPVFVLSAVFALLLFASQTSLVNMLIMLILYVAAGILYSVRLLKEI